MRDRVTVSFIPDNASLITRDLEDVTKKYFTEPSPPALLVAPCSYRYAKYHPRPMAPGRGWVYLTRREVGATSDEGPDDTRPARTRTAVQAARVGPATVIATPVGAVCPTDLWIGHDCRFH